MAERPAALVTGAGVRLGRAFALHLAGRGYDLALHYNSSQGPAQETATEAQKLGARSILIRSDFSAEREHGRVIREAIEGLGRLDLLVNSASAYESATIRETTLELAESQWRVNLLAPLLLTRAFARLAERGGIVNILDNKVAFPQYQYAAYLLAKKGLAELTQMSALEFAPEIRVNGIAPGVTLPAESRSSAYVEWRLEAIPLRQQGEVAHLLGALDYLLDSPFVTGQILTVDGGESLGQSGRNFHDYGGA